MGVGTVCMAGWMDGWLLGIFSPAKGKENNLGECEQRARDKEKMPQTLTRSREKSPVCKQLKETELASQIRDLQILI